MACQGNHDSRDRSAASGVENRPQKRAIIHRVTRIPLPSRPPVIHFPSFLQHPFAEDRYEVQTKISEGTYGEVYLGKERFAPYTTVAIKRLKRLNGLDGFPLPSLREVTALQHIQSQREKMLQVLRKTLLADMKRRSSTRQEEGHVNGGSSARTGPSFAYGVLPSVSTGGDRDTEHDQMILQQVQENLSNMLLEDEDKDPLPNIIHLREVLLSSTPSSSPSPSSSCDICLVFDFVDHSVAGLLSGTGGGGRYRFEIEEIAYIFRRVLVALSRLHAMGIIHRDIKADNLLLSKDGRVFLADFGLCVFCSRPRPNTQDHRGGGAASKGGAAADEADRKLTPSMINIQYRPPEMLLGKLYDEKVDVWTLGCFLAQIFLGHPPFLPLPSTSSSSGPKGGAGGTLRENGPHPGRKPPGNSRSARTELEQLACLCNILGPLPRAAYAEDGELEDERRREEEGRERRQQNRRASGTALPTNAIHPLPRHYTALRGLYRDYLQEKKNQQGSYFGGTTMKMGDSAAFQIFPCALFEPSPVFRQYRGFRRWFLHAVEERKLRFTREALMKTSCSPTPPVMPLLPSDASVDVLCSIFTLSEHERPSAEKLLEMPFFYFIDLALAPLSPVTSMTSPFPPGNALPGGRGHPTAVSPLHPSSSASTVGQAANRLALLQHSPTLQQMRNTGGSSYAGVLSHALLRPGSTMFCLPRKERAALEKAIRESLAEKLNALQVGCAHHHPRPRPAGGAGPSPPPASSGGGRRPRTAMATSAGTVNP